MENETYDTKCICPCCGTEIENLQELMLGDGESFETTCDECKEVIVIEAEIST